MNTTTAAIESGTVARWRVIGFRVEARQAAPG
jgi:hypothetical protein